MSDRPKSSWNPYPLCLDDVLEMIRERSDLASAGTRIPELNGMIELVEFLTDADYRMPAILYGFLKSEVDRLECQKLPGA